MINGESIEKKFEKATVQASGGHIIFPYQAKQQMGKMVEAIIKGRQNIQNRLATNQSAPVKGGFIAEEFHAETFNLDSILKNKESRAVTENYEGWSNLGLKVNDTPDIAVAENNTIKTTAQSKYYATVDGTAAKLSDPKYENVDQLIGPSDQINPTDGSYSVQDQASPEAAPKISDHLEYDGVKSAPLTKSEADQMGGGNLDCLEKVENQYKTESTVQQMGNAAKGAAAMSAVVCGSINSLRYMQLARNGSITADEAVKSIVVETAAAAADSAVKASANAGVQSLLVRYGSEKAVIDVLAKQSMKSMMKTNAVTVGVVCVVDAIKDLVKLGTGSISKEEFYERQGKSVLNTSAGVVGGSLGAAGATAAAAAFGLTSGTTAMAVSTMIGGLSGGIIAGLAMSLAIEVGIEKPYQDLLKNTDALHSAASELELVSKTVFMNQVLFTKYLEHNFNIDNQLNHEFDRIDEAGIKVLDIINRI
jgi:hypothetical protein